MSIFMTMTSIPARSPLLRWLWIAAGLLAAAIVLVTLAPRALAVTHTQVNNDRPSITTTTTPAPSAARTPAVVPAAQHPVSATAIAQQMQSAIQNASPGTTVGIDVVDTYTGATLASLNAGQQFYTASVVKLLIALDTMQGQGWNPSPDTAGQISQMLSLSDDDIADALWDDGGNDAIIARQVSKIGLSGTTAPGDIGEWGETLTTPKDVVSIFHYISTSIPAPARDLIINALHNTAHTAADGTDQYFGIPDGLSGRAWAIKQGWMDLDSSTTLDTTGLVGDVPGLYRYAVVVLTTQPADTNWSVAGTALTDGVTLLHTVLN